MRDAWSTHAGYRPEDSGNPVSYSSQYKASGSNAAYGRNGADMSETVTRYPWLSQSSDDHAGDLVVAQTPGNTGGTATPSGNPFANPYAGYLKRSKKMKDYWNSNSTSFWSTLGFMVDFANLTIELVDGMDKTCTATELMFSSTSTMATSMDGLYDGTDVLTMSIVPESIRKAMDRIRELFLKPMQKQFETLANRLKAWSDKKQVCQNFNTKVKARSDKFKGVVKKLDTLVKFRAKLALVVSVIDCKNVTGTSLTGAPDTDDCNKCLPNAIEDFVDFMQDLEAKVMAWEQQYLARMKQMLYKAFQPFNVVLKALAAPWRAFTSALDVFNDVMWPFNKMIDALDAVLDFKIDIKLGCIKGGCIVKWFGKCKLRMPTICLPGLSISIEDILDEIDKFISVALSAVQNVMNKYLLGPVNDLINMLVMKFGAALSGLLDFNIPIPDLGIFDWLDQLDVLDKLDFLDIPDIDLNVRFLSGWTNWAEDLLTNGRFAACVRAGANMAKPASLAASGQYRSSDDAPMWRTADDDVAAEQYRSDGMAMWRAADDVARWRALSDDMTRWRMEMGEEYAQRMKALWSDEHVRITQTGDDDWSNVRRDLEGFTMNAQAMAAGAARLSTLAVKTPVCGNKICEAGENVDNCAKDCLQVALGTPFMPSKDSGAGWGAQRALRATLPSKKEAEGDLSLVCSRTAEQSKPWWALDMGMKRVVASVQFSGPVVGSLISVRVTDRKPGSPEQQQQGYEDTSYCMQMIRIEKANTELSMHKVDCNITGSYLVVTDESKGPRALTLCTFWPTFADNGPRSPVHEVEKQLQQTVQKVPVPPKKVAVTPPKKVVQGGRGQRKKDWAGQEAADYELAGAAQGAYDWP